MHTKITTREELATLQAGGIIFRYPSNGDPAASFDESNKQNIDTFKIEFIHPFNNMVGLVMTGDSKALLARAGDVGHLFITTPQLITEQVWWV
ncbi:hypothetical protein [Deminuibacter soli]|uniref:Uncharacterized protein n=1 Tax=Deminuibacter soli TaxID=2291815 RepID=A0A3E1NNQ1_9BACT|nr:hypothetical protein [Deminuibacter soli]RFM29561.1 hypothetical protein DXN05_00820 [Deminuibacter soli]